MADSYIKNSSGFQSKSKYSTPTALTITLASLANGAGRQCTLITNSSTKYTELKVAINIKLGTSPVEGTVDVYFIEGNGAGTPINNDGAGASDAAYTPLNSDLFDSLYTGSSPSTGDVLKKIITLGMNPGVTYGIGIVNNTGVALDATGGNHVVSYMGLNLEDQ
jgi:hypothetical protein